ncbi:preprotein translocase subunit YajC [Litorivicinus lipolyticus]|uniref:Sec translocon accessory complex subunit YajC n=1 Tax=Litorivicinus lipolyticus TaxID=418701 RepID=A0A5Q2QFB7_9GAMM|nr:preprotein translocase subunit YajC [Litorivicinus lipolyticus]QGG79705.1 preprotein translocase subunit YajC [Litorivicinus lipolyticus]
MDFLIPMAHAADAPAAAPAWINFGMLAIFIAIFYFLLWRPQQKRAKEHRELVGTLAKGDEVVTGGGVAGTVVKVNDDYAIVELSEGNEVVVQKQAIATTLPKGTLKDIRK